MLRTERAALTLWQGEALALVESDNKDTGFRGLEDGLLN